MPRSPRNPRFVGLYSGAGGLDLGFIAAGCVPVWTNEVDPDASAAHTEALSSAAARTGLFDPSNHTHVCGSIDQLDESALPGKGDAELVIGGPPCQGFSVTGKQDRDDPRNRHVHRFLDIVERVRPVAFVMENVPQLATSKRFAPVRDALWQRSNEIGYDASIHLLNAADFGVPQTRSRMFFIGFRSDLVCGPVVFPKDHAPAPSVREALSVLPRYGEPGNDDCSNAKIVPARRPVLRRSPYAGFLFNGRGRVLDLEAPASTMVATMGGNRTPIIDQAALETGMTNWAVDYHEHLRRGGTPFQAAPNRLRRLTVQEAAVLQSFPIGMRWHGAQHARFRQVGNAVPPKLAEAVARSVLEAIGSTMTAGELMNTSCQEDSGPAPHN